MAEIEIAVASEKGPVWVPARITKPAYYIHGVTSGWRYDVETLDGRKFTGISELSMRRVVTEGE